MNSKEDVESFLGSRLNLQLATIDENGYPNIQPVWFYHDKDNNKLYILTSSTTKKTLNVRNNYKVYFSVDESNNPYKGVKGRGTATIIKDQTTIISAAEKICTKYYGSLDNPASKSMIDRSKEQDAVVIEIKPKFFSTWDFSKMR